MCAEGILQDRHLKVEILRHLYSQGQDLSAISAKNHPQCTQARMITRKDVAQLWPKGEIKKK
jgi:hypothetical protein